MDPGGWILRYFPDRDSAEVFCPLPPLLYAQSLLIDPKGGHAFGHTIPDNHFYHVDLATGELTDHGRISDYAFHHMVVAPDGVCYASWLDKADGLMKLLRFDPKERRLEYTTRVILRDPGSKIAGNQGIDSWLVARNGTIYMGTVANSLLFHFDPSSPEIPAASKRRIQSRAAPADRESRTCRVKREVGVPRHPQRECPSGFPGPRVPQAIFGTPGGNLCSNNACNNYCPDGFHSVRYCPHPLSKCPSRTLDIPHFRGRVRNDNRLRPRFGRSPRSRGQPTPGLPGEPERQTRRRCQDPAYNPRRRDDGGLPAPRTRPAGGQSAFSTSGPIPLKNRVIRTVAPWSASFRSISSDSMRFRQEGIQSPLPK